MNKTIAIELGGFRFHLQPEAFELLEDYLTAIEQALHQDPSADEILQDVEGRIAELLQERLAGVREVVNKEDIEWVMRAIGAPSDFEQEESEPGPGARPQRGIRRLYRDRQDALLAGVASGLGAYFGLDPVWVRGGFIFALIAGGFAIPLYLILWLIVPAAETRAERLTMQGRPVNFENLRRTVGKEVNSAGRRVRKWGRGAGESTARGLSRATSGFAEILAFVLRIFAYTLLFVMLAGFVAVSASLLAFLTGAGGVEIGEFHIDSFDGIGTMSELMALVLPQGVAPSWIWAGAILLLVGPVVTAVVTIIRLLLRPRLRPGILASMIGVSVLVSIAGASILGVVAARVGLEFRTETKFGQSLPLQPDPNGLVQLHMPALGSAPARGWFSEDDDLGILSLEDGELMYDAIRIDIEASPDTLPRIEWEVQASGANRQQARERSLAVIYPVTVEPNGFSVLLPTALRFPVESRFRGQCVDVTLYLPQGMGVELSPSLGRHLRGIKNVDHLRSDKLAGKTWRMTESGLVSDPS